MRSDYVERSILVPRATWARLEALRARLEKDNGLKMSAEELAAVVFDSGLEVVQARKEVPRHVTG
jgi:hypothetical protein